MSNYIEEKLIDIYESDDYKEAVREQMFGLLSFKKEEQFNAYIDVLIIILRNHIRIAIQEQEERIIKKIKSLPRYTFLTDKREFTKQDVISREAVIKILNQDKLL